MYYKYPRYSTIDVNNNVLISTSYDYWLDYRSSLEDTVEVDLLERNTHMPPYPHYNLLGGYSASTFLSYFKLSLKALKKLVLTRIFILTLNWCVSTADTPKVSERAVLPYYRRF